MHARFNTDGSRQYQHIDRVIRRRLRTRQDPCGICGNPIDYSLPQYHPLAFEVDHIVPISRGGLKTIDNSRASHRRCNRQRSNTIDADAIAAGAEPEPDTPTTSRGKPTAGSSRTCPPGPCQRCHGIHNPTYGITFETTRTWRP